MNNFDEFYYSNFSFLAIFIALIFVAWKAIKIVPQQEIWIIERLGKYFTSLESGMHFIIPFVDNIAYRHTQKETAIDVPEQAAITRDNVTLLLDGILYLRIIDAKNASYGVDNVYYAVTQLAQTSMRSAIGKITLDNTFEEREALNVQIVNAINEAASTWGMQCMRYEIKDIKPPISVLKAMETQVAAERKKRADILESEGQQQAMINIANCDDYAADLLNIAEGKKREMVLNSEAIKIDKINQASGESEAIKSIAEATAQGIENVAIAVQKKGGMDAVSLNIAEKYLIAFEGVTKNANTIIVPANTSDASGMIAQSLSIFDSLKKKL